MGCCFFNENEDENSKFTKKPNIAEWRARTSQRFYLSRLKSKLIKKKRLYNSSYTITAKPIKMLELHYPMIQF